MRLSNCLIWALPRWLRGYMRGRVLVIRRSTFTWVPHFAIAECIKDLPVAEFAPRRHPSCRWLRWLPVQAILFRGYVREGAAVCMCEECREKGS